MAKKSAALNCAPLLVVLLELYHQEEPVRLGQLPDHGCGGADGGHAAERLRVPVGRLRAGHLGDRRADLRRPDRL